MYRLGIDFGGTNVEVGVVDENYNISAEPRLRRVLRVRRKR